MSGSEEEGQVVTPSKDREGRSRRHGSRRRRTHSLSPGEHSGSESERESRRRRKHKKKSKKRRHYSVRVGYKESSLSSHFVCPGFPHTQWPHIHVSLSHVHVPFFTVNLSFTDSLQKYPITTSSNADSACKTVLRKSC